jgi:hypothetical protein
MHSLHKVTAQGSIRGVRDVLLFCSVFLGTVYIHTGMLANIRSSAVHVLAACCGVRLPRAACTSGLSASTATSITLPDWCNRIRDILYTSILAVPLEQATTKIPGHERLYWRSTRVSSRSFSINAICQIHLKACRSRPKDSVVKRQQRFSSMSFQALQWIQNLPDVMRLCILRPILE